MPVSLIRELRSVPSSGLQLPADLDPGRRSDGSSDWVPLCTWETWTEFPAPSLGQSEPLQAEDFSASLALK